MLCRIAVAYAVTCTGVEISPYVCREAETKIQARGMTSRISIMNMRGQDFAAPEASFELVSCIGATWVWGGLSGTLKALTRWAKPGGLVAVGEPFWLKPPPADYLAAQGFTNASFSTHEGNIAAGQREGLTPLLAIVSSQDDFDRYEGLTWLAAADFARDNPHDPDSVEITTEIAKTRRTYLKWGRDHLGWAIYLYRKP